MSALGNEGGNPIFQYAFCGLNKMKNQKRNLKRQLTGLSKIAQKYNFFLL